MKLTAEKIESLEVVKWMHGIDKMVVYGSYILGHWHEGESDIDVLIDDDWDGDFEDLGKDIYEALECELSEDQIDNIEDIVDIKTDSEWLKCGKLGHEAIEEIYEYGISIGFHRLDPRWTG